MQSVGQHAVVIGGSLGGLLAARALAGAFGRVTLLERDAQPGVCEPRKGVPQGRHLHGLLARGLQLLETSFPGISADLVAQGAQTGDPTSDCLWVNGGAPHVSFASGLTGLAMSRPLLEATVRAHLLRDPSVQSLDGAEVRGLLLSPDSARVTGVRWAPGHGGEERDLAADLVVDASGRGSRTPAWLARHGYAAPSEEIVRVDITYTTRMFRRVPGEAASEGGDVKSVVSAGTPDNPRLGFMVPVEGGRWIVTLAGLFGEAAPTALGDFTAFARRLPTPHIAALVGRAEALDEGTQYHFPASHRRRYERLARFPAGLLVYGDALCSFNPLYGQGITVAATEIGELRQALNGGLDGVARRFFTRAARRLDVPWDMVVGGDLGYPQVAGRRTPRVRFVNWYLGHLHRAAWQTPEAALGFQRVANLIDPPSALLRPTLARLVLRAAMRRPGEDSAALPVA